MKTLRKKEKEKIDFKIPHSVQDTIPVNKIYKDGVFLIGKDKYSKIFKFTDINYAVASKPDKEAIRKRVQHHECLESIAIHLNCCIPSIMHCLEEFDDILFLKVYIYLFLFILFLFSFISHIIIISYQINEIQ